MRRWRVLAPLLALLVVAASCSDSKEGGMQPPSSDESSNDVGCGTTPERTSTELPSWTLSSGMPDGARGILSMEGNVVAYPFARPLLVDPPPDGPLDKVLLYTRLPAKELTITATLDGESHVSNRVLNGAPQTFPGYINVDHAGCWQVEIQGANEGGASTGDVLYLRYVDA